MTEDRKSSPNSGGKGFGGFSDLVTDVTKDIESSSREIASAPEKQITADVSTPSQSQPVQSSRPPVKVVPQANKGQSASKWFWGIAAAVGIIIFISNSDDKRSASNSSSATYSPPASIFTPDPQVEEAPPVGSGLTLSRNQIRYCLSEDIRLNAMKMAVNSYSDNDVNLFNYYIQYYNSRCGQFRYRQGSLESVRSEVEANRYTLEQEGRNRLMAQR